MSSAVKGLDMGVSGVVVVTVKPEIDKEAVIGIVASVSKRLSRYGDDAFVFFAQALRYELFSPEAIAGKSRGGHERELVDSRVCKGAESGPKPCARVLGCWR
jgi:hypothetical protein